jgi:hypothetical protein
MCRFEAEVCEPCTMPHAIVPDARSSRQPASWSELPESGFNSLITKKEIIINRVSIYNI